MVRTIQEISTEIKKSFVFNETLSSLYHLNKSKTFDEQISTCSLEATIIYIVAVAIWTVEKITNDFRDEVDQRISNAYIASHKWYWLKCKEYQDGDELTFNDHNLTFGYRLIDKEKCVIKYASVSDFKVDGQTKLRIQVAGLNKKTLPSDQLNRFKEYISRIGAAGVSYEITTADALEVYPKMIVYVNPLSINMDGRSVGKEDEYPVDKVISEYFDSLEYGGLFSAMDLCRKLQEIQGIVEVQFIDLKKKIDNQHVANQGDVRIVSQTGSFTYRKDASGITYKPISS